VLETQEAPAGKVPEKEWEKDYREWGEELRTTDSGRMALKLLRDWYKARFLTVRIGSHKSTEGEDIQDLDLSRCPCVDCELHRRSLWEPSTIKQVVAVIIDELEKHGGIWVFFEGKPVYIKPNLVNQKVGSQETI